MTSAAAATRTEPLLEYLDKLEATANATKRVGEPFCRVHPGEVLALIAKLREAVDIVRRATELVARPVSDWRANAEPPAAVLNRFQDQVVEWARIDVPA